MSMDNNRTENKILWWVVGILAACVIAGGSGAFGYTQSQIRASNTRIDKEADTNNVQNERIRGMEVMSAEIVRRLDRIEAGVDELVKEKRDGNR